MVKTVTDKVSVMFVLLFITLSFVLVVSEDDLYDGSGDDTFDLPEIYGSYNINPSFKVDSSYDLSIYDEAMYYAGELISCQTQTPMSACIKDVIQEVNSKDNGLTLKTGMYPNFDEDYKSFYNFVHYLLELKENEEIKDCKINLNTLNFGDDNLKIIVDSSYTSSLVKSDKYNVSLDFPFGYSESVGSSINFNAPFEFNLKDSVVLEHINGGFNFIQDKNSNLETCDLISKNNYVLRNFYFEYDSIYGIQVIPFSIDFRSVPPPKLITFDLNVITNDENKFKLSWNQVTDVSGNYIDILEEYRIYCADFNFTNNFDSVIYYESIPADQDRYEVILNKCNNTLITSDTNYYFSIITVGNSNNKYVDDVLIKNTTSVDDLAPGLSSSYKQNYLVGEELSLDAPIINSDGSTLNSFDGYYVFYFHNTVESLFLNNYITSFDGTNCAGKDVYYDIFCEKYDVLEESPYYDDLETSFYPNDKSELLVYVIPYDNSGNFVTAIVDWVRNHLN